MKLPWSRKEKIDELEGEVERLESKIDELEEEKESFKERFEAEKDRRSELSRKKQEAEEELKKLRQKGRSDKSEKSVDEDKQEIKGEGISLGEVKRMLQKLGSYSSPEEDLVTVYSPGKLEKLADTQGLKNSISGENYRFISDKEFIAFIDPDLIQVKLKSRPFFSPRWVREGSFNVKGVQGFISEKKQWAVVSAGSTEIVTEEGGEVIEKKDVSSRVERKQKKGGFSQGRFERKRQEQIDQHLKQIKEEIDEDTLLVGEERLCKKLPGEFLGGFDDSRNFIDALYGFRLEKMKEV